MAAIRSASSDESTSDSPSRRGKAGRYSEPLQPVGMRRGIITCSSGGKLDAAIKKLEQRTRSDRRSMRPWLSSTRAPPTIQRDCMCVCELRYLHVTSCAFEVSFLTPPSDVDALFVCNRIVDAIFIRRHMQFLIMCPTSASRSRGQNGKTTPSDCEALHHVVVLIDIVSIGVSSFDFYSVAQGAARTVANDGGVVVMQADVISKFKLLRIVAFCASSSYCAL